MLTYRVEFEHDLESLVMDLLSGVRSREALYTVGDVLPDMLREHFETQTGPDGLAWWPLAPLTRALRYAGSPEQPLRESGELYDSLLAEVLSDGVVAGTTLGYGALQQEGYHAPSGKIPLSGTKAEFLAGAATRYPETPRTARPDAPGYMQVRATETPARPFAHLTDEQGCRLIDLTWEELFA